jgi:hypothetical protein
MGLKIQGEGRTVTTYTDIKKKINGLWPSASWNPEERDLWEKTLYPLDQWALNTALDQVAKNYSREKPALRWVLDAYQQIKNDNRPKPDLTQRMNEVQAEENNRANWSAQTRQLINNTDRETLERAAEDVRARVGFKIDIDRPIEEWSYMALGFIHIELEDNHATS